MSSSASSDNVGRGALAVLGTAALVVGCQLVRDRVFTAPTLTFRGVRASTVGLRGGSLEIVLGVQNPNPYSLSAKRANYRLFVRDSAEVGRGEASGPFAVPARDTATVRLPLDVTWAGLRTAGRAALANGTVDYRVVGELTAASPVGNHVVRFDERGRFTALSVGR